MGQSCHAAARQIELEPTDTQVRTWNDGERDDEEDDEEEAMGVEVSVPRSVSFFTMACRTAVTRCASTAVSVGAGGGGSPSKSASARSLGSAGKAISMVDAAVMDGLIRD